MPAEAPTRHWPPEVAQRLAAAQTAHQGGDFARAEAAYQGLRQRWSGLDAAVAAACNGLGLIYHAQGQSQPALAELERAVALDPEAPSHHANLALVLHALQRFDAAEAACREAIQRRPAYPEAWNNLGNSYFARQQHAMARACYREALRYRRTYVNAWMNLARTELALDQADAARRVLHRVLRLAPSARVWHLLAQAENQRRAYAAALAAVEQGQACDPAATIDWLPLHANLLNQQHRPEEAHALQQQRTVTHPHDPEAWNDLGLTLDALNRLPDALEAFDRALLALQQPTSAQDAQASGASSSATVLSRERMPLVYQVRFHRTLSLLKQGDFARGWPEYSTRWERRAQDFRHVFTMPAWQGESLESKHLILAIEQGMGDNLQCLRYLPQLRARYPSLRLTLAAKQALAPLLHGWPGVERLLVEGDPLPAADYYSLLMDLPLRFGTDLDTIPASVPYLQVAPVVAPTWDARVRERAQGRYTVGLAWQGNPKYEHDHHRSFPLAVLAPLFARPDIAWIKLQQGAGVEQLEGTTYPILDIDDPERPRDLMDTAALVQALDLVITPDSMLAHLAGALARPVWVPLSYRGEWRWLTEREDSPWYPTLRLFRQTRPGDWAEVVARMGVTLREIASHRRSS